MTAILKSITNPRCGQEMIHLYIVWVCDYITSKWPQQVNGPICCNIATYIYTYLFEKQWFASFANRHALNKIGPSGNRYPEESC